MWAKYEVGATYDILERAAYGMDDPYGVELELLVESLVNEVEIGPVIDYSQRLVIMGFDSVHSQADLDRVLEFTKGK